MRRDSTINIGTSQFEEIQKYDMEVTFDNCIYNYTIINDDTYADFFGEWTANTALISMTGDGEALAETMTEMDEISGVSSLSTTKEP